MTDFDAIAAGELGRLAAAPAPRQAASLSEIWSAEWGAAGLATFSGSGAPLTESFDELVAGVTGATGKPLGALLEEEGALAASGPDRKAEALGRVVSRLPEEDRKRLQPLVDVRGRAAARAAELEARAAEVGSATYGLAGTATAFLAGLARQAVDPINLAAMPAGGPLTGPVLKMLAREALIGAGVQALQEPFIAANRTALGLETHPLEDIGMAGLGAAGMAGLFRGGAFLLRHATGRTAGEALQRVPEAAATEGPLLAGTPPRAAQVLSRHAGPEDLDAVAHLAERDQVISAAAPEPKAAERIDNAAAALERGKLPETEAPALQPDLLGAAPDGSSRVVIRPDGSRLPVRMAVVDLSEIVASHSVDGVPNSVYPAALQPRDRSAAASRSFVAERAAALEPERLGFSPTAAEGAPIVGPDGIVESGNGRVMMIARAYDRHPDRAAAYRAHVESLGFPTEGKAFPVLVRIREGELEDRAAFAREANISPTAGLSARERSAADAAAIDGNLLSLWRGGETSAAQNVGFVRAFAQKIVAPEERPGFVDGSNRLSAEGARRIEAALVAKGWGAPDVVAALFEDASPTSRSILGALADQAPFAARLRAAIDEGRVPKSADMLGAVLDGFRLVERARAARQPVKSLLDQVDLERGKVPDEIAAAVRLFFRDDELRQAAGREIVSERLERAIGRAINTENGTDMFGFVLDVTGNLRASAHAGDLLDDVPLVPGAVVAAGVDTASAAEIFYRQPLADFDGIYAVAPARKAELDQAGAEIAAALGIKFTPAAVKDRAVAEAKVGRKGYGSPAQVVDIVRGGFLIEDPALADRVVAMMAERFDVLDEGWTKTPAGYLDRKALLRFEDGVLAELQLWHPAMLEAKSTAGHKLYEQMRELPVGDPRRAPLLEQQVEVYSAAIVRAGDAWSALGSGGSSPKYLAKASAGTTRPLSETSALSTSVQAAPGASTAKALAPAITAGRFSQLTKSMGGASDPVIGPAAGAGKAIGDPQLAAEGERILEELGGDLEIYLVERDPAGVETQRRISARQAIAEAEEDGAAAQELLACIGASQPARGATNTFQEAAQ
jgi:hypothetical protein